MLYHRPSTQLKASSNKDPSLTCCSLAGLFKHFKMLSVGRRKLYERAIIWPVGLKFDTWLTACNAVLSLCRYPGLQF